MDKNMLRKALWEILRPLIQLITNLLNPEEGERWLVELKKFLRKEPTWVPVTTQIVKRALVVWRTISVGGISTKDLFQAIEATEGEKEKNRVGDLARDLTSKPAFVIAPTPSQVGLVVLTPADLGFASPPRTGGFITKEFCADWSAKKLDGWVIELCEPEDGLQLRLQYQDQPKGEVLWLAMERITDSNGDSFVFGVERGGGGYRWLGTGWSAPDGTWDLGCRLVFRLRKIPSPSAT